MSSDREQGFDPNSGEGARPLNATQWFGIVLVVLGALAILVFLLGRIGVIPKVLDDAVPFIALVPVGAALLNARRPSAACDPEALRGRRIMVIVLALIVAAGAGLAAFLLATGS